MSTCEVRASPIRKGPGVNASRLSWSFNSGVMRREFSIASNSMIIVYNSSCVSVSVDTPRTKRRFADFTVASIQHPNLLLEG